MAKIITERLLLRPFSREDADGILAIAGDWQVARMIADFSHPMTRADAVQWLQDEPDTLRFAILAPDESGGPQLIGGIGYYVGEAGSSVGNGVSGELGFFLAHSHWGQGYAREAALAVIAQGFEDENLRQFTSSHFIDNASSAKLLSGLGFVPGHRRMIWSRARGCDVESICYRLARAAACTDSDHREGSRGQDNPLQYHRAILDTDRASDELRYQSGQEVSHEIS